MIWVQLYCTGIFMSVLFYCSYFCTVEPMESITDNFTYALGLGVLWGISLPIFIGRKVGVKDGRYKKYT